MAIEKTYDHEAVRRDAIKAGFSEEYSPLESKILCSDSKTVRKFFYLTGGEGAHNANIPARYGGPRRIFELLDTNPKAYWQRQFRDEWTLLRQQDTDVQYVDHFVCRNGVSRLSAGVFPNQTTYPDEVIDGSIYLGGLIQMKKYNDQQPQTHTLDEIDRQVLMLRDIRWNNFKNTKREGDHVAGCLLTISSGMVGAMLSILPVAYLDKPEYLLPAMGAGFLTGSLLMGRSLYKISKEWKEVTLQANPSLTTTPLFNDDVANFFANAESNREGKE